MLAGEALVKPSMAMMHNCIDYRIIVLLIIRVSSMARFLDFFGLDQIFIKEYLSEALRKRIG